jgi:transcriptional regulator with XRE-family HTH domain
MEGKTKLNNRLWQARHKIGLEQKQVARLLGHKTCDQISRYERGLRLPGFQTACKLAIIYGTSLKELFPEHHERFCQEIHAKSEAYSASLNIKWNQEVTSQNNPPQNPFNESAARESSLDAPLCHYSRLLENPFPNQTELSAIKRHITNLVRAIIRF